MRLRRFAWCSIAAALPAVLGCGYSEDEMQAKLREVESVKTQLAAEQSQNKKAKQELDDAAARNEQLKAELKSAGVDVSNTNAKLEQEARALEDYQRRADQLDTLKRRFESLRGKLAAFAKVGVSVTVRNNRMVIQLPGDVLFDSGRETVKKDGQELLAKIAEAIRNDVGLAARTYQVAGHADASPQAAGRRRDAWALSLMRAREVLTILTGPTEKGGGGLPAGKWSAAGYGDTDPLKPSDTAENKQLNGRCELVVMPNVEEMLDLKALTQ
jgi:chemotaxis protein MotB